jgi:hypothetical protein
MSAPAAISFSVLTRTGLSSRLIRGDEIRPLLLDTLQQYPNSLVRVLVECDQLVIGVLPGDHYPALDVDMRVARVMAAICTPEPYSMREDGEEIKRIPLVRDRFRQLIDGKKSSRNLTIEEALSEDFMLPQHVDRFNLGQARAIGWCSFAFDVTHRKNETDETMEEQMKRLLSEKQQYDYVQL